MTFRLNVSDLTAARAWVKLALDGGANPWLIYQRDGKRTISVSEGAPAGVSPIPGGRAFAAIARVLEEIGRVHRANA